MGIKAAQGHDQKYTIRLHMGRSINGLCLSPYRKCCPFLGCRGMQPYTCYTETNFPFERFIYTLLKPLLSEEMNSISMKL